MSAPLLVVEIPRPPAGSLVITEQPGGDVRVEARRGDRGRPRSVDVRRNELAPVAQALAETAAQPPMPPAAPDGIVVAEVPFTRGAGLLRGRFVARVIFSRAKPAGREGPWSHAARPEAARLEVLNEGSRWPLLRRRVGRPVFEAIVAAATAATADDADVRAAVLAELGALRRTMGYDLPPAPPRAAGLADGTDDTDDDVPITPVPRFGRFAVPEIPRDDVPPPWRVSAGKCGAPVVTTNAQRADGCRAVMGCDGDPGHGGPCDV